MLGNDLTVENIQMFVLVLVRISAIMALLPVFGSMGVPMRAKAGLSILMALVLFPSVAAQGMPEMSFSLALFFFNVVKEVAVGITIGFTASFLFVAVQFAGRVVDQQMGFAMAQVIDPFTEANVTATGQLLTLLFSLLFLLLNGHYFLLLAIDKSFELIPLLGAQMPTANMARFMTRMSADILEVGIRLAAPVFVVLVVTSLSLGIVARTVPQINVFFVGLPLRIGLGLITLVVVLPLLAEAFRGMVDELMRDIWRLLYIMA
jgi:flagellar biosynthetic protein FliR